MGSQPRAIGRRVPSDNHRRGGQRVPLLAPDEVGAGPETQAHAQGRTGLHHRYQLVTINLNG